MWSDFLNTLFTAPCGIILSVVLAIWAMKQINHMESLPKNGVIGICPNCKTPNQINTPEFVDGDNVYTVTRCIKCNIMIELIIN